MTQTRTRSSHTFHIPVMGTGFTIDTPLRVAKYGISSVISIVDDRLIEQIRKYHAEKNGLAYTEICRNDEDGRAKRITAYLDLVEELVTKQVENLQASPFETGSEITRYFQMLPDGSLKQKYLDMLKETDPEKKAQMQEELRAHAVPGSIDVNIMTKIDRDVYSGRTKLPPQYNEAVAALRGFANSKLRSAVVLSAGLNPRLYSFINHFSDFLPNENGELKKTVTLKVSDYRSALIQGKFLAKRGVWISEYRIESGLNCGGHAFATNGRLMGPILEEFKRNRAELAESLFPIYQKGLQGLDRPLPFEAPQIQITVQGGIGTAEENEFLLKHFEVDGTGWATPFMLVPEVVNIDDDHLQKLVAAGKDDVYLSPSSPFGIPFWNLRRSASEENRRQKILTGKPGSGCSKGYLVSNTEFTDIPICLAARVYQKKKLEALETECGCEGVNQVLKDSITAKSCLCEDLSGGVEQKYGINENAKTAVCCGPNIVNFSRIVSLDEMIDHIYGRCSILTNLDRPHMFVREMQLYIEYLREQIAEAAAALADDMPRGLLEFKENLLGGAKYYLELADRLYGEKKQKFLSDIEKLREEIESLSIAVTEELCAEASA